MGTRSPITNTFRADQGRIAASPHTSSAAPAFTRPVSAPNHHRHKAATGRKAEDTDRASADRPRRAPPAAVSPRLFRDTERSSIAAATASIALWRFSVSVHVGSSTE